MTGHRSFHFAFYGLTLGGLAILVAMAMTATAANNDMPLSGDKVASPGANVHAAQVCNFAGGALTDQSAFARHRFESGGTFTIGNRTVGTNSPVLIGGNTTFGEVYFRVSTAGTTGTSSFQYRTTADAWATLTLTASTYNNFRTAGYTRIQFTPPTNWKAVDLSGANCSGGSAGARYWIRAVTGTNYNTAPVADQVSLRSYNLVVGVKDELNNAKTGLAAANFKLTAATNMTLGPVLERSAGSGQYFLSVNATAADTDYGVQVQLAGFVQGFRGANDALATGVMADALTNKSASSPFAIQYGQRVTVTRETDAAALTGASVTSNGCTFTESGAGVYYCAITTANDNQAIIVQKAGYVRDSSGTTTDRVADTDPQGAVTVSGIQFGHKILVTREVDSGAVTGASVTSGAFTAIEGTGGAYYIAITPASDPATVTVSGNGYVDATGTTPDRASDASAQQTTTVSNVRFGQKVIVTREVDGAVLTAATVQIGGVTLAVTDGAGTYYGVVPTGSDGGAITVSAAGYVTNSAVTSVDRTSNANAQGSNTVSGVQFTVKVVAATEPSVSGVAWSKSTNGGAFGSVTPDATSGNVAYFALDPAGSPSIVLRATKYGVSSDAAAVTPSAATQQTVTVNLVAVLTNLATSAASLVAGQQTSYTFTFRNVHTWPADGKLSVTFPSGYSIGSPVATLGGAADGSATVTVAGQVVTITRSAGTATGNASDSTLALTQITNPGVSGLAGTFGLSLKDGAAVALDAGNAPSVTLTPGALSATSASGANYGAGNTTTYTFGFTLANPWPATGEVTLDFPSGFDASAAATPALTGGATGTLAVGSASASSVTLTRSGGSVTAGGTAVTLTVDGIKDPTLAATTGVFHLATRDGSAAKIDEADAAGVTIAPGPAFAVSVSPTTWTMQVATTKQFSATGQDQYGNAIPPGALAWAATCGSVDATGLYTAPNLVQTCYVNATDDGRHGSATVSFTPAALDHLVLSPPSASVDADVGTQGYTAEGFDQYGNDRWGETANATFTITPDGGCTAAQCSATAAGAHTVTGNVGGKTGTATLTITPGALHHLGLSPADASITADTASQPYTAQGYDQFNNARGDDTANATFSITPDGSCTAATCTATVVGAHTVTGNDAGKTGSTLLTVTPGALQHVHVAPTSANVTVGQTRQFNATGHDQHHNVVSTLFTWTSSCGTVDAAGLFTAPATPQACTVTTASGGFNDTATVDVQTGGLATITVDHHGGRLWVGSAIAFHANGTDALGNPVAITPSWTATCGSIDPATGRYDATAAGSCTATATDLGVHGNATLTVTAGNLTGVTATAGKAAANVSSLYTFSFSVEHPWPADGKLAITFPAGYNLSAAKAVPPRLESGINGTVTLNVTGSTVTLTRAGGTPATQGTKVTLAVDKIRNPLAGGGTGTFALATRNALAQDIDDGTASGVNIAPFDPATKISVTPKAALTGVVSNYTFGFKVQAAWPADGRLEVVFPGGFALAPTKVTLTSSAKLTLGNATATASGQTLTVVRSGDGVALPFGTAVNVKVNGTTNPLGSGTTAPFAFTLENGTGALLSTGSPAKAVVKISPGVLTWGVASAPDYGYLNVTDYTVGFKLRNGLPAGGQVAVYLPGYQPKTPAWASDANGFEAYAATTVTSTSLDGGWTVNKTGAFNRSIVLVRDGTGTDVPAGTNVTFTVTSVKNGAKAGSFTFDVRTGDGKVMDAFTKGVKVTPITKWQSGGFVKFDAKSHTLGKWDAKRSRVATVNLTWTPPAGKLWDGFSYGWDGNVDLVADVNGTTFAAQVTVPDGVHVFQIRGHNATSGWTPVNQVGLVGIDTTPPTAPIVASVTHPVSPCGSSRVPSFSFSASDTTSGLNKAAFGATMDNKTVRLAAGATTYTASKALAPGLHTFVVTSKDTVGWTASTSYAFTICN